MPAERFFVVLAVITVALTASLAVPWLAPVALAADALLLVALEIDRRRARAAVLRAERTFPPLLVQGVEAEVEVRVTSESPRPVTLRLREGLHPALAEAPRRHRLEVPAAAQSSGMADRPGIATWKWPLTPRRRGEHALAPLTVRVLGPWRLAWSQRDLIEPETLRIYPQVRWGGRVGQLLALARRRELGHSPLRFQGAGSELYAVREYLPGDPLGRIHWKATARHGRLVTREDTWERGARLVILLDCGRSMAAMDGPRSKLDHALAVALALARLAHGRGDRVTLITFSDRVERRVRLRPGTHGSRQAYARLFDQEASLTEPAYDLAAEAVTESERRSATVVLLTSVVDLAAADLLRESLLRLERHHRPLLVNLEDPELVRLAYGPPATDEEAFAKVSGLEILLANRRLARQLRRAGVRVVTTASDRLALDTLEAYLAIFRARAA